MPPTNRHDFHRRSEIKRYLSLILYKTYADLRTESERTYVGFIWWIVEPVLSMLVYYVVFSVILSRGGPDYVAFLFAGLIPWRWFQVSILHGSNSVLSERGLMQQVYLPKIVFPAVTFLIDTAKFLVVFILLMVFFIVVGYPLGVYSLALLPLLGTQALFILSLTVLAGSCAPFVPDIRIALQHFIRLWFFLSGVFYDLDVFSEPMRSYLNLNPMAVILKSYRAVLIEGTSPDFSSLATIAGISILLLALGWTVIFKLDYAYPKMRF